MSDRFAGKAEWFDEHYATTRGKVRLDLVLERLGSLLPPAPARVLDAGGGTGTVAIPLALRGYDVTLLDPSEEWLERARFNARSAGARLKLAKAAIEALPADLPSFDAILCHAVLMYVDDPVAALEALRSTARQGAHLSLLEKNRDALALRPGLAGNYDEAYRLLTARDSVGRLLLLNHAYSIHEWNEMLESSGWEVENYAGIRLFSDVAADSLDADAYASLLMLERAAGKLEPYRSVARLVHFAARAV